MSDPSDTQLDALLARLGRDVSPPTDLWPGIEAQASVQRFRQHRPWRLAAGIAAGTVLATLVWYEWSLPAAKLASTRLQDESHRRAQAQLEQSYRAQLDQLPPDTRLQIGHDLDVIRNARADIRRALIADPGSPLLNDLMATTWQQEIDLYSDVAANAAVASRRNL